MKRINILLFILSASFSICFAQNKVKFGKIDRSDLEMKHYPTDSSARAAFLFDKAETELEYQDGVNAWSLSFKRHLRIKILDKSAFDLANFTIALHNTRSEREKITAFSAATYNLVNGKIEATKFKKNELLKEVKSENWSVETAAMPKIQEGSIIEIKYEIRSPFVWNLWDWQFQYDFPVRYSEYNVYYPEWFQYSTKFKGYDLQYVKTLESKTDRRNIFFTQKSRPLAGGQTRVSRNNVDYQRMHYGWVAEEMPAFVSEAYISNKNNYLVKVDFELSGTKFPNSTWKSYTKSWSGLNNTLLESSAFGVQIKKGKTKFLAAEAKQLTASLATTNDKIAAIYTHVINKMAWNKEANKYISSSLKNAYEKGKGNVAEINLILMAMLQQAGLKAEPLLLSTRKNGFLNPLFPALAQFNYVVAAVTLEDGKMLLLDATEKILPMHLLPTRCINDKGLLVRKDREDWVSLKPNGKYNITRALDLSLNEDMEWEGKMKVRCKDYAAGKLRQSYYGKENEAAYITSLESNINGASIKDYSMEGLKSISKGVKESCTIKIKEQVMDGGDMLYFNPMMDFGLEENPFKLKERAYPVIYPYPQSNTYSAMFTIPEDYAIEELPEKALVTLPNNSGTFSYSAKVQGNKIIFLSWYKINKYLFLPDEYSVLKEFYNIMVEKQNEQIVLKKL
jgi:hypothetical protein